MKIILILCLISASLTAPPMEGVLVVAPEPIKPYEAIWNATCKVESNFDPYAIGDKNLKEYSYGIVQIRNTRLIDYYKHTGIKYTTKDMFDPIKSKEVFMYYARGDHENIARTWNGGPRGMEKKSTLKYWYKIQKELNN